MQKRTICHLALIAICAPTLGGCARNSPDRLLFENAAAELPAAEAEARRLGIPLDTAELADEKSVPPEDNALPLLRQATAAMKADSIKATKWEINLRECLGSPTNANLKLADEMMSKMSRPLQLAHEAASKPAMSFDRDWSAVSKTGINLMELSDMKNLVRALAFRARLNARYGNHEQAIADIRAGFRLSEFSGMDPFLIPATVRLACDSIIIRQVEYILAEAALDREFLQALETVLAGNRRKEMSLLHAFRGEVHLTMQELDLDLKTLATNYAEGDFLDRTAMERSSQQLLAKLSPAGLPVAVVKQAYRARYLQYWSEVYTPTSKPETTAETVKRIKLIFRKYSSKDDPTMTANALILSPTEDIGDSFLKRNATLDSLRGLVAVLNYRRVRGSFPRSLAEAGFKEPDPFSGSAFHLKVDGETVRVYSVGQDGVDNGGQERVNTAPDAPRQMDIVSMFPRRVNAPPK